MKLSKAGIKNARIKVIDQSYPAQDILLQSGNYHNIVVEFMVIIMCR